MKQKFKLYQRQGTYYKRDTETGKRTSLKTRSRREAEELIKAENQAHNDSEFGRQMAKAYLSSTDPFATSRTWQDVMNDFTRRGRKSTTERKTRAFASNDFDAIRNRPLVQTRAEEFYLVLSCDKTSVFSYLIQLQNFALDMGWLYRAVIPRNRFPKPSKKIETRAITKEEHERILAAEKNTERRNYYKLLWLTGASQSDAASLTNANVDRERTLLFYERGKTAQRCIMELSDELKSLLDQLPQDGLLFPGLQNGGANYRASEFRRRCRLLGIAQVTLHSYRYSWAERAFEAGIPERFAMAALGHGSKAVHRAYARGATTICPPLPPAPEKRG